MPTLTATGDAAKITADQTACYVALLLPYAPAPVSPPAPATPGGPPVAQPDSDGSAFESLCHLVGAWIGALVQADAAIPLAELWGHPVTEAQLKAVLDSLSGDDPVPIPLQAIPTQRAFSPPSAPYFDGPTLAALNPDAPLTGAAAFTLNGASQTTLSSDTLPKLAARLTAATSPSCCRRRMSPSRSSPPRPSPRRPSPTPRWAATRWRTWPGASASRSRASPPART